MEIIIQLAIKYTDQYCYINMLGLHQYSLIYAIYFFCKYYYMRR